jgi:hypothetical protein
MTLIIFFDDDDEDDWGTKLFYFFLSPRPKAQLLLPQTDCTLDKMPL